LSVGYILRQRFLGKGNKGRVGRERKGAVKMVKGRREVRGWLWRGLGIWRPCFQPCPWWSNLVEAVDEG
jgi:hypothetical protein